MTDYERLFSGGLSLLLAGSLALALGLAVMKRRPILISPKNLWGGIALFIFPMLVVFTIGIVADSLNSDSVSRSLALSLLMMSFPAAIYTLLAFLITRNFWLFNVTEAMVVDALSEALHKQGIVYSIGQSTNPASQSSKPSRITVALPELGSSIKVVTQAFGGGTMRFSGKQHIEDYSGLVSDFKQALIMQKYDGPYFLVAFSLVLGAIATIGSVVHWAYRVFLR
jgi:hypothetical protein